MVSFGVAVVTHDCRKAKWSAKIGSLSVTRSETRIAVGSQEIVPSSLWNSTRIRSSAWVIPPSESMKSMCQVARRNSPSVADCRPTSSCLRTTSRIASSSTARSSSALRRPAACSSLALRELRGSQERADVVGAERGAGPGGHAVSSSSDRWASSTSRRLRGSRPVRSCTAVLTVAADLRGSRCRRTRRRARARAAGRRRRGPAWRSRRRSRRPRRAAGDLGHQRGEVGLRDELGARDVVDAVLVAVGGEHRGRGRGAVLARDVGRARRRRCCARARPRRRRAPRPRPGTRRTARCAARSSAARGRGSRPRYAPCSWETMSGSSPPALSPDV